MGECEIFNNGPLPFKFKISAYLLPNGTKFGLAKLQALEYLSWCDSEGLSVLGYDMWIPTEPLPTAYFQGNFDGDSTACQNVINQLDEKAFILQVGPAPIF